MAPRKNSRGLLAETDFPYALALDGSKLPLNESARLPAGFLSMSAFWQPAWLKPSAWIGHVPFAFWIIEALRPRMLVELGTHTGTSYSAFCQAIHTIGLETKSFAIDTWKGDEQAGFYGDEIFDALSKHHEGLYSRFSRLVRTSFDDAVTSFVNSSIDLLHIDGLHTYEAVRHDFETWLPKLSTRSVVLFHDTNVREGEFGVFRLWEELCSKYPHFEFLHGNGLGVLGVGDELPGTAKHLFLATQTPARCVKIREIYSRLGGDLHRKVADGLQIDALRSELQSHSTHLSAQIAEGKRLRAELESRSATLSDVEAALAQRTAEGDRLRAELASHSARLSDAKAALAQQTTEGERLRVELASRSATLSDAEASLAQRTAEGDRLRAELASRSARLSDVEAALAQQITEGKRLLAELESRSARLSETEAALAHKTSEGERLRAELESVIASRSWRMTSPIRWLEHFLIKLTRSIRKRWIETNDLLFRAVVAMHLTKRLKRFHCNAEVIRKSGLFDAGWYRTEYKSMVSSKADPVLHYLRHGWTRGCDPNPNFHALWYLKQYPDAAQAGMEPLVHYIQHGAIKGRNPDSGFDAQRQMKQNPDAQAPKADPVQDEQRTSRENESPGNRDKESSTPGTSGILVHNGKPHVVYIAGEPDTPGAIYRVHMYASALATRGYNVHIIGKHQIPQQMALINTSAALVIWRTEWSDNVREAIAASRQGGGKIIFDLDDYMFDPRIAKRSVIDGIRTMGLTEDAVAGHYLRIQQTMWAADFCTAPTKPLATAMRRFQKATFVLPNGFDEETYTRSRRAAAARRAARPDGLVRLGYAGGTRTHQKDFACAAAAIARILRKYSTCRLVLFRTEFPNGTLRCLDIEEFPELAGLESQIEWRQLVPIRQLPDELARFDINLAPLEAGNIFCEAKSELKYFEAALVGVPTVASPSLPYSEAIRHEESGFLAANMDDWYAYLDRLVSEPELRTRIANEAFYDVLWQHGPERRAELIGNVMTQVITGGATAARLFELELHRSRIPKRPRPLGTEFDLIVEYGERAQSEVDVVIPLYNYFDYVEEALDSARAQTLTKKGLIVVEDCSTDRSLEVATRWIERNKDAFTHVALLKNRKNSGLALSRNTGFAFADARFIMPLDADNVLLPQCLERCLKAINESFAAVAFPTIQEFDENHGCRSCGDWQPSQFVSGNYVDAMALIRRSAWAAAGGYERIDVVGWEDYDLWCKFVQMGLWGVWLREVLARYRAHNKSMLNTTTEILPNRRQLVADMRYRHWWIDVSSPEEPTTPSGRE